jgi:hypothetical protein
MVNASEQGEVTVLETYEDVVAFVEGEDTGETVNVEEGDSLGTSEEAPATPEAGVQGEQPARPPDSQSPTDVSDMSEEELIRNHQRSGQRVGQQEKRVTSRATSIRLPGPSGEGKNGDRAYREV